MVCTASSGLNSVSSCFSFFHLVHVLSAFTLMTLSLLDRYSSHLMSLKNFFMSKYCYMRQD
jgi:hypothetical protein